MKEIVEQGKGQRGRQELQTLGTVQMWGLSIRWALPRPLPSQRHLSPLGAVDRRVSRRRWMPSPGPATAASMACGKFSTVKKARHKGPQIEGPEYETIYAFGVLGEIVVSWRKLPLE